MGAPIIIDLTGQRFDRLVAVKMVEPRGLDRKTTWLCHCDCGGKKEVTTNQLRRGRARSCGCLHSEKACLLAKTHGLSQTKEYPVWIGMLARCYNPNRESYANYGGRGIKVCERWRNDFSAFYADMGPRPTPRHTIDRIDNNGNYEPGNCRWATPIEQARNTRKIPVVEVDGQVLTLREASERKGLRYETVKHRLWRGLSLDEALVPYTRRTGKTK